MRKQRGYLNISDGEMLGCLGILFLVAASIGGLVVWLAPKVLAWLKPIIHLWTA